MITSDFVFDAISKVVERFDKDGYTRRTYFEVVQEDDEAGPEEIHFFIEDEIRTLLDGLGLKNVVECVDVYWNLEIEMYNVYVCFVLDGELYNCDFIAERRF